MEVSRQEVMPFEVSYDKTIPLDEHFPFNKNFSSGSVANVMKKVVHFSTALVVNFVVFHS